MTKLQPPGFLGAVGHPADSLRRLTKSLAGDSPGVVGTGDLKVTSTGSGPLGVIVAAGSAFIAGTTRATIQMGYYHVTNDANVVLSLAGAHGSLYRRDLVVAVIRDTEEGGPDDSWDLQVIAGTPAAIGAAVAPAVPNNAIALAEILIAPASTIVSDANITDKRPVSGTGLSVQYAAKAQGVANANGVWKTPSEYGFSTDYDLSLSMVTGARALVNFGFTASQGGSGGVNQRMGVRVNGASNRPADSGGGFGIETCGFSCAGTATVHRCVLMTDLTPGLNIFNVVYRFDNWPDGLGVGWGGPNLTVQLA